MAALYDPCVDVCVGLTKRHKRIFWHLLIGSVLFCLSACADQSFEPASMPVVESQDRQDTKQAHPDVLSPIDRQSMIKQIKRKRFEVQSTKFGYEAHHPTQPLKTTFDIHGAVVYAHSTSKRDSMKMTFEWFGRDGQLMRVEPPFGVRHEETRVTYVRDGVVEWYEHQSKGVEQGFVLEQRPEGSGVVQLHMKVDSALTPKRFGRDIAFVDNQQQTLFYYQDLVVWDAQQTPLVSKMRVGEDRQSVVLEIDDRHAIYPITIDPTTRANLINTFTPPKPVFDDRGQPMSCYAALDGDIAVVPSLLSGLVNIYQQDMAGDWRVIATLRSSDDADNFGRRVALKDDTIVVMSEYLVHVFQKPQGGWRNMVESARLTPSDGALSRGLDALAFDGTHIAVGARSRHLSSQMTFTGAVYLFKKPVTGWVSSSESVLLTSPRPVSKEYFGQSVSLDGQRLVVGAPTNGVQPNTVRHVYIFEEMAATWSEVGRLSTTDVYSFGEKVIIKGDSIFVASSLMLVNGATQRGTVRVYEKGGLGWSSSQFAQLTTSDSMSNGRFGQTMFASTDTIVASGEYRDANNDTQFRAYLFERGVQGWSNATETTTLQAIQSQSQRAFHCGIFGQSDDRMIGMGQSGVFKNTTFVTDNAYIMTREQNSWTGSIQQSRLNKPNSPGDNRFGETLAMDGQIAVVGTPRYDLVHTDSGLAYVFEKQNGQWVLLAKLSADTGVNGKLGSSVAIFGDVIVLGSSMAGQNGAAFVYEKPQGGWVDMTTPTASLSSSDAISGFGAVVDIHDTTIVVGCQQYDSLNGAVYVYERQGASWSTMTQTARLTSSVGAAHYLGASVSVNAEMIVAGAPYYAHSNRSQAGGVYVYTRPPTGWVDATQTAVLVNSIPETQGRTGTHVSINQNTILTNGPGGLLFEKPQAGWVDATEDARLSFSQNSVSGSSYAVGSDVVVIGSRAQNRGVVYVYDRPQSGWVDATESSTLVESRSSDNISPLLAIVVSGNTILGGIPYDSTLDHYAGAVLDFQKTNGQWTSDASIFFAQPYDFDEDNLFGHSIHRHGDFVLITDPGDDSFRENGGAGHLYFYDGQDWMYHQKLLVNHDVDSQYGTSASLSQTHAVLCSPGAASGGVNQGQCVLYGRSSVNADHWPIERTLIAFDASDNNQYGTSVVLSETMLAIGAQQSNGQGAIYLYERDHPTANAWGLRQKIVATDGLAGHLFGKSVAIDGDWMLVGAPGATGPTSGDEGAAYLYQRDEGGLNAWGLVKKLSASNGQSGDLFGISVDVDSSGWGIVGATGDSGTGSMQGAAHLFGQHIGGQNQWGVLKKITEPTPGNAHAFGATVRVEETFALVSAPDHLNGVDKVGATYAYRRFDGGRDGWGMSQMIEGAFADQRLGSSIDVHGVCRSSTDPCGFILGANGEVSLYEYPNGVPQARDTSIMTAPNTPVSARFGTFSDAQHHAVVQLPQHGSVVVTDTQNGDFTYTPDAQFSGQDTFIYEITDGIHLIEGEVTVLVNSTPVATVATVTTDEDVTLMGFLPGSDADMDPLTFEIHGAGASKGIFTLDDASTGAFTYVPFPQQNGVDSIFFKVKDAFETSAPARLTIQINPVNDAPFAQDGLVQTQPNMNAFGMLSANDIDGGDTLTYRIVANGSLGTATIPDATQGLFVYTPRANARGVDTFTFQVNDGLADSNVATMRVTVGSLNEPPVLLDSFASTDEDMTVTKVVPAMDAENDPLTFVVITPPQHGTVTWVDSVAGIYLYTPAANFHGQDIFTVQATDGSWDSNMVDVLVTVRPINDAPVFVTPDQNMVFQANDGEPLTFVVQVDDVDLDPISLSHSPQLLGATLDSTTGVFSWTPSTDYMGMVSITLSATDGAIRITRKIIINVNVPDLDGDGLPDSLEVRYGLDPNSKDSDGDTISDLEEFGSQLVPINSDDDVKVDARDEDSDNDGLSDREEAGDDDLTTPARDSNGDGIPDYRDKDIDKDTILDGMDNCPFDANTDQLDEDQNNIGDICQDDDNDGILNVSDNCPFVKNEDQKDSDGDDVGDACEGDDMGDMGTDMGGDMSNDMSDDMSVDMPADTPVDMASSTPKPDDSCQCASVDRSIPVPLTFLGILCFVLIGIRRLSTLEAQSL